MDSEKEAKQRARLKRYIDLVWGLDCSLILLCFNVSTLYTIIGGFIGVIIFEIFLGEMHEKFSIKFVSNFLKIISAVALIFYGYLAGLFSAIFSWFFSLLKQSSNKPNIFNENVA